MSDGFARGVPVTIDGVVAGSAEVKSDGTVTIQINDTVASNIVEFLTVGAIDGLTLGFDVRPAERAPFHCNVPRY